MPHEIVVTVPLTPEQTMTLLRRAAEALHHSVVRFDAEAHRCDIRVDFDFRSFATFSVHAEATARSATETELRLETRPGARLTPWTGFNQSPRVGWRIIGKMQELLDPQRYRNLKDRVLPSRRTRPAGAATPIETPERTRTRR
jgi:hypothetical protein